MAPMPTERYGHICGLVTYSENGPEVVAAGGISTVSYEYLNIVEIYSVLTNSWREGIIKIWLK